MKRNEFLNTLGIGLAAVCAGGCLAACGKSESGSPKAPSAPGNVNFTVDLNNEIKNVGESKVNSGVIVARISAGNTVASFTAVQVACTHEGTSINYNANQGQFICPNHGSRFSTSGGVLLGPATSNLKNYTVAISGNTLTVTG